MVATEQFDRNSKVQTYNLKQAREETSADKGEVVNDESIDGNEVGVCIDQVA